MKTKFVGIIVTAIIAMTLANCQNEPETPPPPATVVAPVATPPGGEVADNTAIALATTTAGAAIHYTQDGTEPSAESALYSDSNKPVITTGKLTLKAIAVKSDMNNSAVLTATYTLTPPNTAAKPAATPASGEVADNTAITLATTTAGAAIRYTQDGTEPTAESALYSDTAKPVITAGKLTLKAIAVKSGMNNSAILTEPYTIATATPPTASITNNNQTVTLAPELEITLNGAATKGTNEIKSYEWAVKTTENGVTPVFTSPATAVTKVTGIKKAGTYVFELKVKDTADLEGTATATVVVNAMTVTQNVKIVVSQFNLPTTTLNFSPSYQAVDGLQEFFTQNDIDSRISYTLKDTSGKDYTTNNGIVNWNDNSLFNGTPWPPSSIVQTFYLDDNLIAKQELIAWVNGGKFTEIYESSDTEQDYPYTSSYTFPPVTLTLTKTITEILPPEEE